LRNHTLWWGSLTHGELGDNSGNGPGCGAPQPWTEIASYSTQNADFVVTIDVTPTGNNMNGIVGVTSNNTATNWDDLAAMLRFNDVGEVDVRDGGSYSADATFNYNAQTKYNIQMDIAPGQDKYDVKIKEDGASSWVQLATDYNFRENYTGNDNFDKAFKWTASCQLEVSDFEVSASGTQDLTINGTASAVSSYSDQDAGTYSILNNGNEIRIDGNVWKKAAYAYTVTPNTILNFEVKIIDKGELHGITVDNDNDHNNSSNQIFYLWGDQSLPSNWIGDYAYTSGLDNWQGFSIPIGQYFTGNINYLAFIGDEDRSGETQQSSFRNISLSEDNSVYNGYYVLKNRDSGLNMRNQNCNTSNETPVELFNGTGDCAQWEFVPASAGYYYLENRRSGLRLRTQDCNTSELTLLELYNGNDACAEWKVIDAGDGYVHLQNKAAGLNARNDNCEDVNDQTLLELVNGTGYCAQWEIIPEGNNARTTASVKEKTVASTPEIQEEVVKLVYPNPSSGKVTIRGVEGPVKVYDRTGRKIAETKASAGIATLDLAGQSGILIAKTKNEVFKIIIQ